MVRRNPSPSQLSADEAAKSLTDRIGWEPRVAMLLGTGHVSIANQLEDKVVFTSADLPEGMAHSEDSQLIAGTLEGVRVVVTDPPLGAYGGHGPDEVAFPVRVLRAMGARLLILTAGAASLSHQLEAGNIAVLEDHINLSGIHPLQGPNDNNIGPRFPDMTTPYTGAWSELARDVATEIGVVCLPGIFAAVPGPSLPTRAEYRFLGRAGADLVGMSVVPEVLAAVHSGFEVLALVGITQQVKIESASPVDIEAMLDAADLAVPRMASMLIGILRAIAIEENGLDD